jgi:hypothetical protein
MKHLYVILLCLVAVFIFSTVVASAASAAEEYLFSTAKFSFTSQGHGSKALTVGGNRFECTEMKNTGETENAHLGKININLTGCEGITGLGNFTCKTTGAASGEIVLSNLLFHLGTASENAAVIILLPTAGIVINCGALIGSVTVKGNIIGLLFKLDGTRLHLSEPVTSANLVFKDNGSTGVQEDKTIAVSLGGGTLTNQHLTINILGKEEESSLVTTDSFENSLFRLLN